jgi:Tol biopolymer transport system component
MSPRILPSLASLLFFAATCLAQTTELGSVSTNGAPGSGEGQNPSLSADGRYLAFLSTASLVAGDTNGQSDIYVRDRLTGAVERVSVASDGSQGDGSCDIGAISADGRFVAFSSTSDNLVAGDTNGVDDVFVHDRQTGVTERVSVSSTGVQGNGPSGSPSISADGRYVAFSSQSGNLIVGTNGWSQIYVRDRQTGTTFAASVTAGGALGNFGSSASPAISRDGHTVAFESMATNLVPGDNNGMLDVYVHDFALDVTERISVSTTGGDTDGNSGWSATSGDGRYVQFMSTATNLVANDTNNHIDVFVRDRQTHTTERVSVSTGGAQSDSDAIHNTISADGRYSVFSTMASTLVAGDVNGWRDVFLRDRQAGTTELVSYGWNGNQGNYHSDFASISDDARYVAFDSSAGNLLPFAVVNGDVYVRDRSYVAMTSVCDPGSGGVIPCPCANAPAGSGRGCDNSAATGGASLSAVGTAYLDMDHLVFTTNGEKPTATSILLQGTGTAVGGVAYGQGVRCVGGTMKRLYTKAAVAGSVTMPDSNLGDPSISARSAAIGSPIAAAETLSYLVFYRDPIVLGGCAASRTFNATQTGLVTWRP